MGNSLSESESELSDEDDVRGRYAIPRSIIRQVNPDDYSEAVGSILNIGSTLFSYNSHSYRLHEMPKIRKRPDITTLRHTQLFKEIKALCAYPVTSSLPCETWSLTSGLLKRENGIVSQKFGSFSPNQQRRIRTLFVPNNKEERLMSLEAKIFVSSFNKSGSKLITGSQDAIVRIYDSSKGTYHLLHRLRVPDVNWSILDIDFSPCGEFFAYSTWSDYFFVLPMNGSVDKAKWYELNAQQHRNAVFSIRFSPAGDKLIGGCSNSCVYLCDLETRDIRVIRMESRPTVDINAVSFLTDGDPYVFVSGCNSGSLKLWDTRCSISSGDRNVQTRRCQPSSVFLGHLDGITYIDSRNDGHYVLTNSKDQSIKIWDLRMPTPSHKVRKYSNRPSIEWDYRWDMVPQEYYNSGNPLDGDVSVMSYRGHRVTKSLLRAKFSPMEQTGQRYIYTGCGTGRIIIYDVLTGSIKEAIHGHKDIVRDLGWHPIRSEIVSSSWDSHVNLNTFKPNPLLKNTEENCEYRLVDNNRRSRRIEQQNNTHVSTDVERDDQNLPW